MTVTFVKSGTVTTMARATMLTALSGPITLPAKREPIIPQNVWTFEALICDTGIPVKRSTDLATLFVAAYNLSCLVCASNFLFQVILFFENKAASKSSSATAFFLLFSWLQPIAFKAYLICDRTLAPGEQLSYPIKSMALSGNERCGCIGIE